MQADRLAAAPKVELHVHLEGAIPLATLWELIDGHGGDPEAPDLNAVRDKLVYQDFTHFIGVWSWMTGFLRTPADFTRAAAAVAHSLAAQRIVYAEASISPIDFVHHGASVGDIVAAVRRGLDKVGDVDVNLNVDLVRDRGPATAMRTLDAVIEVAGDAGVAGITIGGTEHDFPPEPFRPVYERARNNGLRLTAHAGEAAGPSSVWGALRDLGVERIGHGIRAVEDPGLLEYLVESQIPLEVCPTSNMRTGVAPSWEAHPLHELIEAGANVTVSTDDPTFFHCDLAGELAMVAGAGGGSPRHLTQAAVAASWLDAPAKDALSARVDSFWDVADGL